MMKFYKIFFLLIFINATLQAQDNRNVSLKITDKKGRPVSNIIVQSRITGKAGVTDRSGIFIFEDMSDSDTIAMMLPKYGETFFPVAGMDSLVVSLRSARSYSYLNNDGQGVIVNKSKTTPSSVIDVPEILKQGHYSSLAELLQGRVAGLNITNMGVDGQASAKIRGGINSANLSSEPLVILNGSPVGTLSDANRMINIYEIKTVEIQKSGTEYGARGANGVILIKSK